MLPTRSPGSPARTNDQWSLDRCPVSGATGTPARSAARTSAVGWPSAAPTGTTEPTPTRSSEIMPRTARRWAGPRDAT